MSKKITNQTVKKKQAETRRKSLVVWSVLGLFVIVAMVAGIALTATPDAIVSVPSTPTVAIQDRLPEEIAVAEAKQMQTEGAFLLDVREPDEWSAGHIDGATLIPLGELSGRLNEVPKDRPVVVVCRSGNRSAQGRDVLLGAGYDAVTSMAGGMNDWKAQGYPVVTGP